MKQDKFKLHNFWEEKPEEAPDFQSCDMPDCCEEGLHKAPHSRESEGKFHNFCLKHVREYNKNYNYFQGMSLEEVEAYNNKAAGGDRPSWSFGDNVKDTRQKYTNAQRAKNRARQHFKDGEDTASCHRSRYESAAEYEARRSEWERASTHNNANNNNPQTKEITPEQEALRTMGLNENATYKEISKRYKTLAKRFHPDTQQGNAVKRLASSEARMRDINNAWQTLKQAQRA